MKYLFKVNYNYAYHGVRCYYSFTLVYHRRFSLNTLLNKFYAFCAKSVHKDVRIEELIAQYIREN